MTAPIVPILPETVALAVEVLAEGGLVAIPTETVYGLAADAANPDAVVSLYEAKGRPRFNPLIAHVSGIEMAMREAVFSPLAARLAGKFWPGPLTLVLPALIGGTVCDLARSGLQTIGLRCPAHPAARILIGEFGRPLVAPSANRSGHVSPTRAEHVAVDLADRINLILDGGPCEVGIESTILAVEGDTATLLRAGAVPSDELEAFIGQPLARASGASITAPGMLKSHYAPKARLRLNIDAPDDGEGYLGFGPASRGGLNLSPSGDLAEAATKLFAMLRALDERFDRIAVAPIPMTGLGEAINDRLARAAHRD
ncbi:threonylcarbamoyl-AMP synthase [Hyphomonas sp. WL0036]|uniref:L-threonylcarbamoyladenylate synthase n=1 Tax=Hyphomonas sediminis TaxID=2866160 RepID=UPI001C7E34BD|nr:L-threonylcarbamoyladenylate synthase [Hyphomonas sediminis]MBY9067667.1 threonylcarbamoyl-AMP synthase [Hyphomonas sediminis]